MYNKMEKAARRKEVVIPMTKLDGNHFELGEDDSLKSWVRWDKKIAKILAKTDKFTGFSVNLTDEYWEVISCISVQDS